MSGERITEHPRAWRIELPDQPGADGVVVEVGSAGSPYWWVLCPASATLVMEPDDDPDGGHDDGGPPAGSGEQGTER